jgi:hypothetical protein
MFAIVLAITSSAFLAGPAPHLPEGLRFGMKVKDACVLIGGKMSKHGCNRTRPKGVYIGVPRGRRGEVYAVTIASKRWTSESILAERTKAWGRPRRRAADAKPGTPKHWWDNPERGVRVQLNGTRLDFLRLTSLSRLLGSGRSSSSKVLGFERSAPILGATRQRLLAAYAPWARRNGSGLDINLPATPAGTQGVNVRVRFRRGIAMHYAVVILTDLSPKGSIPVRERVRKRLRALYGAPRRSGRSLTFTGPPLARIVDYADSGKGSVYFTVGGCNYKTVKIDLGQGRVLPCVE